MAWPTQPRLEAACHVLSQAGSDCPCGFVDKYSGKKKGTDLWNRLTVHHTPKHGSWLNQAEIEISLYARQCLGKRRIPDLGSLRQESRAWNQQMNRARVKINWKFSRRDARNKFGYNKNLFKRS